MEILCKRWKGSDRFGIAIRRYRDENFCGPDVNSTGVRSHNRQTPVQFPMLSFFPLLCHGSSRNFGNEPGVQEGKVSQAGSSQLNNSCASPMFLRTSLGSNSWTGSPKASTNGATTYTYRRRAPFPTPSSGQITI